MAINNHTMIVITDFNLYWLTLPFSHIWAFIHKYQLDLFTFYLIQCFIHEKSWTESNSILSQTISTYSGRIKHICILFLFEKSWVVTNGTCIVYKYVSCFGFSKIKKKNHQSPLIISECWCLALIGSDLILHMLYFIKQSYETNIGHFLKDIL